MIFHIPGGALKKTPPTNVTASRAVCQSRLYKPIREKLAKTTVCTWFLSIFVEKKFCFESHNRVGLTSNTFSIYISFGRTEPQFKENMEEQNAAGGAHWTKFTYNVLFSCEHSIWEWSEMTHHTGYKEIASYTFSFQGENPNSKHCARSPRRRGKS